MSSAEVEATLAILALPQMGPRRMGRLIEAWGSEAAWHRLQRGSAEIAQVIGRQGSQLGVVWAEASRKIEPGRLLERCQEASIELIDRQHPEYPAVFEDDPEPPWVLFRKGDARPVGPVIALVGTRRCTRYGSDLAAELGRALSARGVHVLSGLAIGIDGAAHRGVLAGDGAAPIGVVGTGLDVVYPKRHRDLWQQVADRGVLWSESPPGTTPDRWRFPARNRIIAAMADVVCVVESSATGGAMHTVNEALERGREVAAVPGSIRSEVSVGTNRLLRDGARPVLGVQDLLEAVGADTTGSASPIEKTPRPDPAERAVIEAVGWEATTLGEVAAATGLGVAEVAAASARLVASGALARRDGRLERCRPTLSRSTGSGGSADTLN